MNIENELFDISRKVDECVLSEICDTILDNNFDVYDIHNFDINIHINFGINNLKLFSGLIRIDRMNRKFEIAATLKNNVPTIYTKVVDNITDLNKILSMIHCDVLNYIGNHSNCEFRGLNFVQRY